MTLFCCKSVSEREASRARKSLLVSSSSARTISRRDAEEDETGCESDMNPPSRRLLCWIAPCFPHPSAGPHGCRVPEEVKNADYVYYSSLCSSSLYHDPAQSCLAAFTPRIGATCTHSEALYSIPKRNRRVCAVKAALYDVGTTGSKSQGNRKPWERSHSLKRSIQ